MRASRMQFRRLNYGNVDWDTLDRLPDRTVFQTREWLGFLAETQNGEPIVAELWSGSAALGYFSGLVIRRFHIRILGSSFPGWTTPYIGFNLLPGVSHSLALQALERFAFGDLRCMHVEISDHKFQFEDGKTSGFDDGVYGSFETDLTQSEDTLLNNMSSACRRCIRKADKNGVRVEQAYDLQFADDYYTQLRDVFAKQKLVPTYDIERVRSLIRHLLPAQRLLLLRAIDPSGRCIATGIYPGMNKIAQFWGNASFRRSQNLRPNELLHWSAMCYWKKRGAETFDWGGGGEYKKKYGGKPVTIPWFRKSRFGILKSFRQASKTLIDVQQRVRGRLQ